MQLGLFEGVCGLPTARALPGRRRLRGSAGDACPCSWMGMGTGEWEGGEGLQRGFRGQGGEEEVVVV